MTFEDFLQNVKSAVDQKLPDGISLQYRNIRKNNEVSLTGACISRPENGKSCQVIYMDPLYRMMEDDREIRLTPAGVRQAIVRIGEDLFPLLLEVKEADMLAQSTFRREEKKAHIARVRELYAEILEHKDCLTLRDLAVNGNDLISYGIRPGKEMGRILHEMLEDVLAEPSHNDREYLLQKWSIVTGRS